MDTRLHGSAWLLAALWLTTGLAVAQVVVPPPTNTRDSRDRRAAEARTVPPPPSRGTRTAQPAGTVPPPSALQNTTAHTETVAEHTTAVSGGTGAVPANRDSFWTTLPGILTGLGTLIAAIGGIFAMRRQKN